ncbi:MAG: multicopper oxidase family protein [Sulfolobaceae archaeon]
MKRRDFIKAIGITAAIVAISGVSVYLMRGIFYTPTNNRSQNYATTTSFNKVSLYGDPRNPRSFNNRLFIPQQVSNKVVELEAREISSNKLALNYAYHYISNDDNNIINPILRVRKGDEISVKFVNNLPLNQKSIIHWHGLYLPWDQDGHPIYAVNSGEVYTYSFKVYNRGGTYWYHPHPMGITSLQSYMGLASLFIIEDEDEERFKKEYGVYEEIPLIIQDKRIDAQGNLVYSLSPIDLMMGYLGDKIVVNFTPNPYLELDSKIYRFRILNASNARKYKLSLVTYTNKKLPFYLIGVDGGFLNKPVKLYEVFVDVAERIDIIVDLREFNKGDVLFLKSESFNPMHLEEMMGNSGMHYDMMGHTMIGNLNEGEEFYILKIIIKDKVQSIDQKMISENDELSSIELIDTKGAVKRRIVLSISMMPMRWTINGLSYDINSIPIKVNRESIEIWELTSIGMPHPFHIHGGLFQVLERVNSPSQIKDLSIDKNGRLPTDLGWKDTVTVWPNEIVRIAVSFSKELSGTSSAPYMFSGRQLYLLHCHNLEHEDNGMMLNYSVE